MPELPKMTPDELCEVMSKHAAWLDDHPDGKRAEFADVDLSSALYAIRNSQRDLLNFRCAYFSNVVLCHVPVLAMFDYAVLTDVYCANTDFYKSSFVEAQLTRCDLSFCNFNKSTLKSVTMRECALNDARLIETDLRNARFIDCNVSDASFCRTNIAGATWRTDPDVMRGHDEVDAAPICRMDFSKWSVFVGKEATQIGCTRRENEFWLSATTKTPELRELADCAAEWWGLYGTLVKSAIRAVTKVNEKFPSKKEAANDAAASD